MTIFFIICSACFDPIVSTCLDFIQKTFFRALNFIMRSLCSLDFCLCVAKAIFSTKAEFAAAVQTLNIKTITSTLLELSFGDIPEKQREHRRKHLVKRSGRLVRKDLQYLNKVLFSLEYLMQMRFPVKRGALVIYPAVPVYGIYDRNSMCHQLRRLASFNSCPGVRFPPGTFVCQLVNSGYYFHVASQRIICFACGDLYPSHADVCHREHENVTFLQPPSEDPDGVDVAGRMNVQVRPSDSLELREDFRQQLNDASSVNTATAAGAIDDVQETDLEGNAPRDNSGIYGSGLMENQVCQYSVISQFLFSVPVWLAGWLCFCLSMSFSFPFSALPRPLPSPAHLSISLSLSLSLSHSLSLSCVCV